MPVTALSPGYEGQNLDAVENFHGNQVVYLHWEQHLMFCAALAAPVPQPTSSQHTPPGRASQSTKSLPMARLHCRI